MSRRRVAFVLGGGGVLGATQVGMLRALSEADIRPDVIVGTSVGALNGAVFATDPSAAGLARLSGMWASLTDHGVFAGGLIGRARTLARSNGTYLHTATPLRRLLGQALPETFAELGVPFQCLAAQVETASARWFDSGSLREAVLASCAVPGLLPPVAMEGHHYVDGGLVDSTPVERAVELGATRIYVLHVGRLEHPLAPPRRPWEVGLVAFEIARRHRFVEVMGRIPDGTEVVVLPSGIEDTPLVSLRYRNAGRITSRIELAHRASSQLLAAR